MANAVSDVYKEIYQLNYNMLEMVQKGKWMEFISLAEMYIIKLQDVINCLDASVLADECSDLRVMFNSLIENENKIETKLKIRLDVLKAEMSSLNRGKKINEMYMSGSIDSYH